jgi:hypothetical protein
VEIDRSDDDKGGSRTPLHWSASSDDVKAADALLERHLRR